MNIRPYFLEYSPKAGVSSCGSAGSRPCFRSFSKTTTAQFPSYYDWHKRKGLGLIIIMMRIDNDENGCSRYFMQLVKPPLPPVSKNSIYSTALTYLRVII